MTTILRRAVVVALLAAWTFPAAGFARTADPPATAPPPSRPVPAASDRPVAAAPASASQTYAQREQQSRGLEDFRGGEASIYIGGGALTVLLLILLIVILV